MSVTTYAWDFFGPHAEGTARHFLHHLDDYRARVGAEGCESGVESAGTGHHAVWCKTPLAADAAILQLKPHRRRVEPG